MNIGTRTALLVGLPLTALGVGAALLDKPRPVGPRADGLVRSAGEDQPIAYGIALSMTGAAMLSGLIGTAMLMSLGKGHTIPPRAMDLATGVAVGFGAAAGASFLTLFHTSNTSPWKR